MQKPQVNLDFVCTAAPPLEAGSLRGAHIRHRLEACVDRSGGPDACHLWTARTNRAGYGLVPHGQKGQAMAHRVAYVAVNGPIPAGALVCHRCDVPACCNPAHLFLGSILDNNRDKYAKGRHPMGEALPSSKLTDVQVIEVRKMLAVGHLQRDIAKRFGVGQTLISRIARGASRRHVG